MSTSYAGVKFDFSIILTFNKLEQQLFTFSLNYQPTEEDFLTEIFIGSTIYELKDLIKISVAQYTDNKEEFFDFLEKRNGKFFFIPPEESDIDYLYEFKNLYIESRIRTQQDIDTKNKEKKEEKIVW